MAEDVEAGRSVATSFQERGGKLLPAVFIETIRAGEESGNLSKAFETMYQHYDKQDVYKRQGQTMDQSLVSLVRSRQIDKAVAVEYSHDQAYVKKNA